jgi:hypothetical protein
MGPCESSRNPVDYSSMWLMMPPGGFVIAFATKVNHFGTVEQKPSDTRPLFVVRLDLVRGQGVQIDTPAHHLLKALSHF